MRQTRLSDEERAFLRAHAAYEGSPHHKRNPGDFGLTPPSAPRPDKTLCDEAAILNRELAERLFGRAIDVGLVSEAMAAPGFPKQLWIIDRGRVRGYVRRQCRGPLSRLSHPPRGPALRADPRGVAGSVSELEFIVGGFIGGGDGDPASEATFAALRIEVDGVPLTEVDDSIAKSVRPHIYVPLHPLARWLVLNWWRLRWEPRRTGPTWREAHSLAAISGDYAWPALELSSDGDFIQLHLAAEPSADVAAIRYLRPGAFDIPAAAFERAVDSLLDQVDARLANCLPGEQDLRDLRAELTDERKDSSARADCRAQAIAGIDPGAATAEWLQAATRLRARAGEAATDEVMAILPETRIDTVNSVVDAMSVSPAKIDLAWVGHAYPAAPSSELPWQKGARIAGLLRGKLGIKGKLPTQDLADLLTTQLPVALPTKPAKGVLSGGFRNGVTKGKTAVLVPSQRLTSQRFFLSRLIGCASLWSEDQHLLPVTSAPTATQKFERSFAQEFLCPWIDLDAFTDEHGVDDDGIAEAAEHFEVSEHLVLSTLVNHKKLSRERLPPPQ